MAGSRDRGQAFTLESMIAALLLVTAVLFALQSVVITSDSAGTLDRDVQSELQQEASDALVTAANDGELSRLVRYWNLSRGTFEHGQDNSFVDAAPDDPTEPATGYERTVVPIQHLGESLNHTIREGNQYNMVLAYRDENHQRQTQRLVFQGTPGSDVVEASYTVTLTDDQLVTGSEDGSTTLAEANASDSAPIPDAAPGSPIYNVVEVRVVIW